MSEAAALRLDRLAAFVAADPAFHKSRFLQGMHMAYLWAAHAVRDQDRRERLGLLPDSTATGLDQRLQETLTAVQGLKHAGSVSQQIMRLEVNI